MVRSKEAIEYKTESHNDIVLKLNKITLANIFHEYFGKKGNWSPVHFIHQKEPKDYTLEEIRLISLGFQYEPSKLSLSELKEICSKNQKSIDETDIANSLIVKTNFEFPVIKGEGKFQVTKGFIDLIVHLKPLKIGEFCCYNTEEPKEFIIEIKKERDFDDFGNILRQIKEYREYYYSWGVKQWDSEIMGKDNRRRSFNRPEGTSSYFCIIADNIPEEVKEIFSSEDIITISLADYKQKTKEANKNELVE